MIALYLPFYKYPLKKSYHAMIIMALQEDSSHLFFEKRISLTELKCFDHELRVFPLTIDPSSVYFVFVKLKGLFTNFYSIVQISYFG